jgi:peroxiredoxin
MEEVHADGTLPLANGEGNETTGPYTPELAETRGERPTIPGYQILGELGHGGMGVVYKARQLSLDRLVALKMIWAGAYARPEDLARFRIEVRAVAHLQHPHIVQFYDAGEWDGRPYFALEFLGGGSLARDRRGRPLPAREAAQMVETLAGAMHYAHQRGIVHRDLKPSNVLLTEDGIPKITDFGLAKQIEADSSLTQSGAIIGTPSYMAPEQARGETKEVGPVVDVYALGAILYELLTGRPPFRAHTPVDTILLVRSERPVPPSRLKPDVPRTLEAVCLKCLEKEPGKRYPNAATLGEDLKRFLTGGTVLALPVTRIQKGVKWAKRNLRATLLIAGLAATLLIVVSATLLERPKYAEQVGADKVTELSANNVRLSEAARFSRLEPTSPPPGAGKLSPPPAGPLVVGIGVGNLAPETEGEGLEGKPLKLSDYRARVVLLVFWANWSPFCRPLYRHLKNVAARLGDKAQFTLLGVNSDKDKSAAQKVIRQQDISWPNIWDDPSRSAISSQWGVEGIPYLVLLDAKGVIRFKFAGLPENPNLLDEAIAGLLAELNHPDRDSTPAVPRPAEKGRE